MYNIQCVVCEKDFNTNQRHAKVCSTICRKKRHLSEYGIRDSKLPSHYLGTLHEYKVYLSLAEEGIHVYQQFLPSSRIDAVIITPKETVLTMDVKTGYRSSTTGYIIGNKRHKTHVDIIGMYIKNEKRVYFFDDNAKPITIETILSL